MSANRRHRRSRVWTTEGTWRRLRGIRRETARRQGWFTGRLFIAGDAGNAVTYSAPLDPAAWPVTYTNTVGFSSPGPDGVVTWSGSPRSSVASGTDPQR